MMRTGDWIATNAVKSCVLILLPLLIWLLASRIYAPATVQPVRPANRVEAAPVQRAPGCLKAQPCSAPVSVDIVSLIEHGNRYDRRPVRVSGKAIMLRLRRGECGSYRYFVLQDKQGYHVSVTDYTDSVSGNQVTVTGFYRAELHNIDVCTEVSDER